MPTTHWNDALLNPMRLVADEPADRAVTALFAVQGTPEWGALHRLLGGLVDNSQALPPGLPAELVGFLSAPLPVPQSALVDATAGEQLFAEFGPEILMLLGCFSLPAAYSAAKGAKVLCRTEFLEKATELRLFQTAQMIVDVLTPGGLGPRGRGLRTIQRVRLLHASIRHLILTDTGRPWDTESLGVPINQEDLAGTMCTFSTLILDGLVKLRIAVTPAQEAAYFNTWRVIGRLMGILEPLIPPNVASGRALMREIQRRQVAASPEGIRLTKALLTAMSEGPLPPVAPAAGHSLLGQLRAEVEHVVHAVEAEIAGPVLRRTAAALMRRMLADEYDAHGHSVADLLQIPATGPLSAHLLSLGLVVGHDVVRGATDTSAERRVLRWFNLRLINWMVGQQLRDRGPLFSVPDSLHAQWMHATH